MTQENILSPAYVIDDVTIKISTIFGNFFGLCPPYEQIGAMEILFSKFSKNTCSTLTRSGRRDHPVHHAKLQLWHGRDAKRDEGGEAGWRRYLEPRRDFDVSWSPVIPLVC